MSNKYNRTQNIRKRKNYRKTKKNKYNRIEGGLSRQSSLKTLYSKHKIAFKICDDYITNNCVIEDREYLKSPNKLWKSIILNEKEYKKTGINGEYGSIDIIESSDLLTQPKSSDLLTQPEKLCVKSFSDPNNYEEEKNIAKIINKLIQNNKNDYEDKFGVVPSYYNDEFKLIVMHHKNSDLKYLLDTKRFILTKYTYIEICKDIFKYVKNLALEGLFYVDLKETNILIQNEYPPYKVYLGDI
jgi:hypothetical protein